MPDLFHPGLIEHLTGVTDGAVVPVPNGSEARWAIDNSGRQCVRKREADTGVQPLLAEAASYLLALELHVRQPHAGVFHDGQEWSWMSERLRAAGEHWDADMRDLIANPEEVGRMLALDALTFNEDRHRRNLLVEPVGDAAHLRVWAIDSGNAEIGSPSDFVRRGLAAPSPHNHAHGLPIEALRPAALAAAQVAVQLADDKLRAILTEACGLAREPAIDALTTTLIARCRNAPAIVSGTMDALGARP